MKKLVWNNNKLEWVDQTEEELDAEFRANHGGKSALEIMGCAENPRKKILFDYLFGNGFDARTDAEKIRMMTDAIMEMDKTAFVIICNAEDIFGEGFADVSLDSL